MNKASLLHVFEALENYKYWIEQYPETVKDYDEDELKIAIQIVRENLDAIKKGK